MQKHIRAGMLTSGIFFGFVAPVVLGVNYEPEIRDWMDSDPYKPVTVITGTSVMAKQPFTVRMSTPERELAKSAELLLTRSDRDRGNVTVIIKYTDGSVSSKKQNDFTDAYKLAGEAAVSQIQGGFTRPIQVLFKTGEASQLSFQCEAHDEMPDRGGKGFAVDCRDARYAPVNASARFVPG